MADVVLPLRPSLVGVAAQEVRMKSAATKTTGEAYFERQMEECQAACDDFERAALVLMKHGATREALIEQLDEAIERGW